MSITSDWSTVDGKPIVISTVQEALDALREQVALEGEDFVYKAEERADNGGFTPDCAYFEYDDNGLSVRGSCIVGRVLYARGLRLSNSLEDGNTATGLAHSLNAEGLGEIDADAAHVLREAQVAQDVGKTWGDALKVAEAAATILSAKQSV